MTNTSRRLLATVLSALASIAVLASLLATYANRVLINPATFSDRAVRVVRSSAVESLIASTVTDRVMAIDGGQASVQPMIAPAVSTALSTGQITKEVRASAASLQRQLLSGTATSLALTLPDAGSAIAASVGSESPQLAATLRSIGTITFLSVPIPSSDANVVHDMSRAAHDWSVPVVIAVALVLLALVISPNRARTLRRLGLGALVSGLLTVAVYLVGRELVVDAFSGQDARTVTHGVWSAYLGGLETWGLVLAAIGALVAVAATVGRSRTRQPIAYDRAVRRWR